MSEYGSRGLSHVSNTANYTDFDARAESDDALHQLRKHWSEKLADATMVSHGLQVDDGALPLALQQAEGTVKFWGAKVDLIEAEIHFREAKKHKPSD